MYGVYRSTHPVERLHGSDHDRVTFKPVTSLTKPQSWQTYWEESGINDGSSDLSWSEEGLTRSVRISHGPLLDITGRFGEGDNEGTALCRMKQISP